MLFWNEQYFAFGNPIFEGEIVKTRIATLVVFALGILAIGVFVVRAQITAQLTFKMSQPFTVGDTALPAGRYVVTSVSNRLFQIAAASGKPSVLADVNFLSPDAS